MDGEEIRIGDRVLWHGVPAIVESVVTAINGDPENDWNMTENGPGVLIREVEAREFGLVYETEPEEAEDIVFVSRAEGSDS